MELPQSGNIFLRAWQADREPITTQFICLVTGQVPSRGPPHSLSLCRITLLCRLYCNK